MHQTKVIAGNGHQDILITRQFDLPVELLFQAHTDPHLFEQWMSHEYGTTRVLKLEGKPHGSWKFETTDATGKKIFGANGVIHEFIPNERITRTFEMENSLFPVQLEFLEFTSLTDDSSQLTMLIIFKSPEYRDKLLAMPFAQGLNMAHNRLQNTIAALNDKP